MIFVAIGNFLHYRSWVSNNASSLNSQQFDTFQSPCVEEDAPDAL
jgi:hypothetical protein